MLPRACSCWTLCVVRGRVPVDEHLRNSRAHAVFGRQQDSVSRPRQTAVGLVDVDSEIERRGHVSTGPMTFGGELIKRDRVAKATLGRATGCREKAVLCAVTTVDIGV